MEMNLSNDFEALTIEQISNIAAGHGSWDSAGEWAAGSFGATTGTVIAGPVGGLVGGAIGFLGYWLMK